jgi:hypothetical protein
MTGSSGHPSVYTNQTDFSVVFYSLKAFFVAKLVPTVSNIPLSFKKLPSKSGQSVLKCVLFFI